MHKRAIASLSLRIQKLPLPFFVGFFCVSGLAIACAESAAPFLGFAVAAFTLEPLYKINESLACGVGFFAFCAAALLWIPLNILVGYLTLKLSTDIAGSRKVIAGLCLLITGNVILAPALMAQIHDSQTDPLHAIIPIGLAGNLVAQIIAFALARINSKRGALTMDAQC